MSSEPRPTECPRCFSRARLTLYVDCKDGAPDRWHTDPLVPKEVVVPETVGQHDGLILHALGVTW